MKVHPDFRELLVLFQKHGVEFVIVGAYALAFHGAPRYTGDLDILVKPDFKNAENIMRALDEFGFGSMNLSTSDFISQDKIVQLGVPPVRIDIFTSITGVSWNDVWLNKVAGNFGDLSAYYVGREQFILNKKTLGRKKDLADLESIGVE